MCESLLRNTRFKIALIFLFAGSFLTPGGLGDQRPCDSFCTAKRLLNVFYPQFHGKDATLNLWTKTSFDEQGPLGTFQTSISLPVPTKPGVATGEPPEMEDHVTAFFQISPGPDGILNMQSIGRDVNQDSVKKLDELVASHPEWSDSQVISAVESSGAKYPPSRKQDLIRSLPLRELEPFVGRIRIDSVTFDLRTDGEPPTPLLDWSVDFTASTSGKPSRRYFLVLEPFDGQVTIFARRPNR